MTPMEIRSRRRRYDAGKYQEGLIKSQVLAADYLTPNQTPELAADIPERQRHPLPFASAVRADAILTIPVRSTDEETMAKLAHGRDSPIPKAQERIPLPDALDFAFHVTSGGPPDTHTRNFWEAKGWADAGPEMIITKLLDQRLNDGSDIWRELGILPLTRQEPQRWLETDVTVFLVGVHERLSGKVPSIQIVLAMIDQLVANDATPIDVITSIATEYQSLQDHVDVLLSCYPGQARKRRWPWQKNIVTQTKFDKSRLFQASCVLRMAQHLSRIKWGAAPFSWVFNGAQTMHRSIFQGNS